MSFILFLSSINTTATVKKVLEEYLMQLTAWTNSLWFFWYANTLFICLFVCGVLRFEICIPHCMEFAGIIFI